jgi:hypothetical protein
MVGRKHESPENAKPRINDNEKAACGREVHEKNKFSFEGSGPGQLPALRSVQSLRRRIAFADAQKNSTTLWPREPARSRAESRLWRLPHS